jgi:hypothetical protein
MPAAFSFSCTAVIAWAFCCCATFGSFARDSALIDTNARSGATVIIPSP